MISTPHLWPNPGDLRLPQHPRAHSLPLNLPMLALLPLLPLLPLQSLLPPTITPRVPPFHNSLLSHLGNPAAGAHGVRARSNDVIPLSAGSRDLVCFTLKEVKQAEIV